MAAQKYSVELMVEAIRKNNGMITLAARAIGCSPNTIRKYAEKYVTVHDALNEERELLVDEAERALLKAIQRGEGWAVCFALKTLGKQRGYIEKHEIVNSGSVIIEIVERDAIESTG